MKQTSSTTTEWADNRVDEELGNGFEPAEPASKRLPSELEFVDRRSDEPSAEALRIARAMIRDLKSKQGEPATGSP